MPQETVDIYEASVEDGGATYNDSLKDGAIRRTFGTGEYELFNDYETADVYFIASNVGLFAPRCADHDWAGMKATIVVD